MLITTTLFMLLLNKITKFVYAFVEVGFLFRPFLYSSKLQ